MDREKLITALREAGVAAIDPYLDDAVQTRQRQIAAGKKPWPVEAFVVIAQHQQAAVENDQKRMSELSRRLWHLQGNEGEPGLTDEERAQLRAQVSRLLKEI